MTIESKILEQKAEKARLKQVEKDRYMTNYQNCIRNGVCPECNGKVKRSPVKWFFGLLSTDKTSHTCTSCASNWETMNLLSL